MEERGCKKSLKQDTNITITGPIPVTEHSHPFSAMAYSRAAIDVEAYGYMEEEYFMEGTANVYGLDAQDTLLVQESALPYRTRLLIRRPIKASDRKPRVFLDIMNASNGYDIEDQWRRSWRYIMEQGYSYIGITSKPINIMALKYFDFERYHLLDWSGSKAAVSPMVPDRLHRIDGCEEGLVWDMLTQLGAWVKQEGKSLFAEKERLYLYLTGQSQSGIYLNTYVNQIYPYQKQEEPLFDGFLSLVSGGLQRSLSQTSGTDCFIGVREYPERPTSVPFISMNSEGDYQLFAGMSKTGLKVGRNVNSDEDKRRYYEIPGAPHTDAASPLVPVNEEIVACKCPKRILDGEYAYRLNDFPLDYYINGLLEQLHGWASEGIVPDIQPRMEVNKDGTRKRDQWGNALGGLRTAFLEVPKASYTGSVGPGETNGTMKFFDQKTMEDCYGSKENYLKLFEEAAKKDLQSGHIVANDFNRMMEWAETVDQ